MLQSARQPIEPRLRDQGLCSQPGAGHAWDCPKVPKLDPERVAWTCARCGAVAVTDELEIRPPA